MSTLKVDTITKADGTGSLSVPAESGTVVTTASPSLGRRNLIINGGFDVWQRGTSITGTNYIMAADRWWSYGYATNSTTVSQQSALGSLDGFSSFKRIASTSARVNQWQRIENLKQFQGQTLTLSFYAKSSDVVSLSSFVHLNYGTGGTSTEYNMTGGTNSFTLSGAWTRYTYTFSMIDMSAKTFGPDNTSYLELGLQSDNGDVGTLDITGVQLEVGSVATPFEHRSYGEELALCQRYFYKPQVSTTGISASGSGYATGAGQSRAARFTTSLPVSMRAAGSVTVLSFSGGNTTVGGQYADIDTFTWYPLSSAAGSCYWDGGYSIDAEL